MPLYGHSCDRSLSALVRCFVPSASLVRMMQVSLLEIRRIPVVDYKLLHLFTACSSGGDRLDISKDYALS